MKSRKDKPNYKKRYGNAQEYKHRCGVAHRRTKQKCCFCLVRKSQQIHHTFYLPEGNTPGFNEFPVCKRCHLICHKKENWITNSSNPVYGNKNIVSIIKKLRTGYRILSIYTAD